MQLGRRRHKAVANSPNRYTDNALTASGFRVNRRDSDMMRRLVQPWQMRSLTYYDVVPEIKYAAQFYSRMLSPLRLYAAVIDENEDVVETNQPEAISALARIQDPGGGRSGLIGAYGRLMFLTGECYLFVSNDNDTGLEQWEVLSTDELRIQSGTYIRYKAPSLIAEEYIDSDEDDDSEGAWVPVDDRTAVAYRLWQRHPRYSMLADSTMQGVLDLCEELLLLTQAVRARARSRLAGSGILLIDERVAPAPLEPGPDEDPDEDPFLKTLTEAMTAPIMDEGAASQIVPITVRVPTAVTENGSLNVSQVMHHLQIIDPTQFYPETGLRYECVKRIAIGLDMPPEVLLGMTDANHWTAWQIDIETWRGHGMPKAQQLCDDLTSSYFRPYLRDVVGLADWQTYCIAYDASAIVTHPDRTKDAKDLYEARAIGKRALREAANFDEEDAPDDDELAEMIGIAVHDASLAWYGEPSVKAGGILTGPDQILKDVAGGTVGGPPQGGTTGAEAERQPPEGGPKQAEQTELVGAGRLMERQALVGRVLGAAEMALHRSRELAGSRIRSYAKRDPEILALLNGAPNRDVAAVLGKERVKALRAPTETDLVNGSDMLIRETFVAWGLNPAVADAVTSLVERHAVRTLYERPPRGFSESYQDYIIGLLSGEANGKP